MHTSTTVAHASLVIPSRYVGPPGAANGGWLAGHLASYLDWRGPAQVTLRAMTPVESRLELHLDPVGVALVGNDTVLATARPVDAAPVPPPFVNRATAEEATYRFEGLHEHPFPGCFVCGPDHPDGMRIYPGVALGRSSLVATTWTPPGVGPVAAELVWAALDCPSGWSHLTRGGVALLGTITGVVHRPVLGGETYVVVGQAGARQGRKLHGAGGVYTLAGELVAASSTIWIDVSQP